MEKVYILSGLNQGYQGDSDSWELFNLHSFRSNRLSGDRDSFVCLLNQHSIKMDFIVIFTVPDIDNCFM